MLVQDSGKGIHPDDLPHIFERYYQSKKADQIRQGGTGIGLALVKEYATLMQGDVFAESELGKGSTFYFEIPLKLSDKSSPLINTINEESEEELNLVDNIGHDFNILVVEDNRDMSIFISHILSTTYKSVHTVNNGQEGYEYLIANEKYMCRH